MALSYYFRPDLFRPRNLVPAVLAMVVVGGGWFAIRQMQPDEPPPPEVVTPAPVEAPPAQAPPPEPVIPPTVLVARVDMGAGIALRMELIEWQQWHEPLDLSLPVITDAVPIESVIGSVTRNVLAAGEPVTWDKLLTSGAPGSVTALLRPGYRAMTVSVDQATTRAQIIYPGNHVDVILVHSPGSGGVPSDLGGPDGPASQVIVRNVRVLAVGSATMEVHRYGPTPLAANLSSVFQTSEPPTGETYTLELSPLDAERIALATVAGHLTLIVRPEATDAEKTADLPPYHEMAKPVRFAEVMQGLASPEVEFEPLPPLPKIRVIRGRGRSSEETLKDPQSDASQEAAELLVEALRGG
ncbi:MAG: Flp pilus assembly protein CpaB [Gammaproteobacteria bacterium]|nr:Flp pilus assembly protein CpaB [Gammaproteobacteria bacterium]